MIAEMKRFDALITTQKAPALCEVPFLKKSEKSNQKYIFFKNYIFLKVFVDFRNGTLQRAQVFCVALTGILNFLKEGRRAGAFGASAKASGQKG